MLCPDVLFMLSYVCVYILVELGKLGIFMIILPYSVSALYFVADIGW